MDSPSLPGHVAIILDGNGRWAQRRGLPRLAGHRAGVRALRKNFKIVRQSGTRYLSLFGFSTENWNRPTDEVRGLMRIFLNAAQRNAKEILDARTRFHWIGSENGLAPILVRRLRQLEEKTKQEDEFHLILAINYGGRDEVVRAARRMAGNASPANPSQWTWENFSKYLDTRDIPDVDLVIRTSGEQRLSNFMLMQMAYAEIFFTPTLWPDFTGETFQQALDFYASRDRRRGTAAISDET
ncbi:MAG: di-trans,poly-cis-decaprenylcistransferase [Puniceicoccales bacterium]|jgi:undecaprenyl diphosphate synthase|nr:di-trans,poly-cis-decaprenylcistransferase [Puniceicoccales bacterium]